MKNKNYRFKKGIKDKELRTQILNEVLASLSDIKIAYVDGFNSLRYKDIRRRIVSAVTKLEPQIIKRNKYKEREFLKHEEIRKNSNGYLVIKLGNKTKLHHRHIMEQHLKRPLRPFEVIHHINGKKDDNRLENLMLLNAKTHNLVTIIEKLK